MFFRLYATRHLPPSGPLWQQFGLSCPTLTQVVPTPFPVSFETLAESIRDRPGLYWEMDGSFVWTGSDPALPSPSRWQLDGMVYDAGQHVQYLELRGMCPISEWHQLLQACQLRPPTNLFPVIQWIEQGVWIDIESLEHLWLAMENR